MGLLGSHVGAVWRALRVTEHLLTGIGIGLWISLGRRLGLRCGWLPDVVRWWHQRLCRCLALCIETDGRHQSPALLIANHVSWLDIPVLGALGPITFLSKQEVRAWPVIGWMSMLAETLFIERGAHQAASMSGQIADVIHRGRSVTLFPEGTTGDGRALLRFHPRLFAVARLEPTPILQPVAIRYGNNEEPDPVAPFIGDDSFLPHLGRVLRRPGLRVQIAFLPPIDPGNMDRRALADASRRAIGSRLGLLAAAPEVRSEAAAMFGALAAGPGKAPPRWLSRHVADHTRLDATTMSSNDRQPLTLAVVTETYPPEINGVANTMRQLVLGLSRRGHSVQVIRPRQGADGRAGPAPAGEILVPGLPIPGYRGLRFGLPVYWRLCNLWRWTRPDAVYVATQGPLGHAALNAARTAGVAVVTGFHTQFQQYSRYYGLGLLMRPIVNALRNFHNRSDGTLVPTSALEHALDEDGFRNVQVFGRGVDTAQFSPAHRSADLRLTWGCDDASIVALYVGRIAAEKNIGLALRAFDAISADNGKVRCVLVGDGPELSRLRRMNPNYVFAGARVGDELARFYASADCFVFPSMTETFGNVVPEAMASGLAVIAFDYAAAHEHIEHWRNGVLVPQTQEQAFVEAVVAAVSDRARLGGLGAAARSKAECLGWDRVIGDVEQRLRGVIRCHAQAGDDHETMAATAE